MAYGGQSSEPRTSFRLNRDGNVTASYSHASLVFPHGIDATASGDAYILNSAGVGIRDRLFKFDSNGGYLADFAIPETDRPSDIAINETSNELYIADEFGSAIHVYDISSGAPIFRDTLSIAERPVDVFVEPISGRIFGTAFEIASDEVGLFRKFTGFEISRGGQLINLYAEDAIPREQSVNGIVAVVPEPASALLFLLAVAGGNRQCRARRRTEHD